MRYCINCKNDRLEKDFVPSHYKQPTHYNVWCRDCNKERNKSLYQNSPKYRKTIKGYVYIITNSSYEGWIKVGLAKDVWDRLSTYQTHSPFRDYVVEFYKLFEDMHKMERVIHNTLSTLCMNRNSEWFEMDIEIAKTIITNTQE